MAGLPAALALVPWGLLIEKAPAIASGAADLYAKVRGRKAIVPPVAADDPLAVVRSLEARIVELEAGLQGSTRLIAELAEANAGLLAAAERGRRATWIAGGVALLALATAAVGLIV